jgi:hypothetical protein
MQARAAVEIKASVKGMVINEIQHIGMQDFFQENAPGLAAYGCISFGEALLKGLDQGCHTVLIKILKISDIFLTPLLSTKPANASRSASGNSSRFSLSSSTGSNLSLRAAVASG